jgi:hypothetical protein
MHHGGDFGSFPDEAFRKVTADEASCSGDQDFFVLIASGH